MEPARYSRAAIALHWIIAAILAFQIALGWRMGTLTAATGQFHAFQLHKSIGITILLLSLARVLIRFWKPRPAPHHDRPWARRLAGRSEEHTSELQSLMRISYAVFCLKKQNQPH